MRKDRMRLLSLLLAITMIAGMLAVPASAESEEDGVYEIDFADITAGEKPTEVGNDDYFTINWDDSTNDSIKADSGKWGDNYQSTNGLQFNGATSSADKRTIQFTTTNPGATVKVWFRNSNSSDRYLVICKADAFSADSPLDKMLANSARVIAEFTCETPDTYVLGAAGGGLYIHKIVVTDKAGSSEGNTGTKQAYTIDFADITAGEKPTEVGNDDYFTINWDDSTNDSIKADSGKWSDNYQSTNGLQFNGATSSADKRTIQFTTTNPGATVKVWFRNSNSSDRYLVICKADAFSADSPLDKMLANGARVIAEFTCETPDTYVLGAAGGGLYIHKIVVTETIPATGGDDDPCCDHDGCTNEECDGTCTADCCDICNPEESCCDHDGCTNEDCDGTCTADCCDICNPEQPDDDKCGCAQDCKCGGTCTGCTASDDGTGCECDACKDTTGTTATVSSVTITGSSHTVAVGSSIDLTATVTMSDSSSYSGDITWTSSNTAAATVSGGKVTGVAAGSTNITASAGGKTSDAFAITVTSTGTDPVDPTPTPGDDEEDAGLVFEAKDISAQKFADGQENDLGNGFKYISSGDNDEILALETPREFSDGYSSSTVLKWNGSSNTSGNRRTLNFTTGKKSTIKVWWYDHNSSTSEIAIWVGADSKTAIAPTKLGAESVEKYYISVFENVEAGNIRLGFSTNKGQVAKVEVTYPSDSGNTEPTEPVPGETKSYIITGKDVYDANTNSDKTKVVGELVVNDVFTVLPKDNEGGTTIGNVASPFDADAATGDYYISFGGSATNKANSVAFTAKGDVTVKFWAIGASDTPTSDRYLGVKGSDNKAITTKGTVFPNKQTNVAGETFKITATSDAETTYYAGSMNSNIFIYKIEVIGQLVPVETEGNEGGDPEQPSGTKHTVTVTNGTSDKATAAKDEKVTVTAGTAPSGQVFDKWTSTDITLTEADAVKNPLTFTMPDKDVTIVATFKTSGTTGPDDPNDPGTTDPDDPDDPGTGDGDETKTTVYTLTGDELHKAGISAVADKETQTAGTDDFFTLKGSLAVSTLDSKDWAFEDGQSFTYRINTNDVIGDGTSHSISFTVPEDAKDSVTVKVWTRQTTADAIPARGLIITDGSGGTIVAGKTYTAATTYIETLELTNAAGKTCYLGSVGKGVSIFKVEVTIGGTSGGTTDPEQPSGTKHTVTVTNGTSDKATAAKDEKVTVTAGTAPSGQVFDKWTSTDITLTEADAVKNPLTFTMPDKDVTIVATFKTSGTTGPDDPNDPGTTDPDDPDGPGTGGEGTADTTALKDAIAAAKKAAEAVKVSEKNGSDVSKSAKWVTQEVMDAYNKAIEAAQAVADKEGATEAEIKQAVENLAAATTTFEAAQKNGTRSSSSGGSSGSSTGKPNVPSTGTGTGTGTGTTPSTPSGNVTTSTTSPDGTKTETVTEPNGTKTETVTKPDGTKTETVSEPDGTTTETVTKPDGTKTETVTEPDGSKKETVTEPDGSKIQTVTKADGSKTESVKEANGDITVTATASNGEVVARVELPATVPALDYKFEDVPSGHWAESAINTMAALNVVSGVSNNGQTASFDMDSNITRGAMAQILFNMSNGTQGKAESFGDVAAGAWYTDAVAWAAAAGVVTGYSDNSFGPDDSITREQLAVMLYRYADLLGLSTSASGAALNSFADSSSVSSWSANAMAWAVSKGLIQGKGANNLDPAASASRAETAVILQRFLDLMK